MDRGRDVAELRPTLLPRDRRPDATQVKNDELVKAGMLCESQSYLARKIHGLVAYEECFPGCVDDFGCECVEVVECLYPPYLGEQPVNDTEVSSGNSGNGRDSG